MADNNNTKKTRLIILGIILIAIIILIAFKLSLEKEPDGIERISKEDVCSMLSVFGVSEDEYLHKLQTDEAYTHLINEDMVQILNDEIFENKLANDKEFNALKNKYTKAKPNFSVDKEEWLEAYDLLCLKLNINIEKKDIFILADRNNNDELKENELYTSDGIYIYARHHEWILNYNINAYIHDKKIVYAQKLENTNFKIENVYIQSAQNDIISIFYNKTYFKYNLNGLENEISSEIADITFENGQLCKIDLKQDRISGKVLAVGEDFVEIESYGRVPTIPNLKVYKEFGTLEEKNADSILVGYDVTDFVTANGKICAAFIMKDLVMTNIRVLLKTQNYEDIYHEQVSFTCNEDFSIIYDKNCEEYSAGDVINIMPDDERFNYGRIFIKPKVLSSRLQMLSYKRDCGNPVYRGSIELLKSDDGIIIINETGLEEYLYAVIPSEMPQSYGIEALKTQAVCARSYAYNQILGNYYSEFGAHVDDSVSYQVYANQQETAICTQAVKETYGEVVTKDDNVIDTYYFSTSSGHTSDGTDWLKTTKDISYLKGKAIGDNPIEYDLSDEAQFYDYITKAEYKGYESEEAWYRWNTTIKADDLSATLNGRLGAISKAKPENILVKDKKGEYVEKKIDYIGEIKEIIPIHRCKSGMLTSVVVTGDRASIKINGEYNIRYLLAPVTTTIYRDNDNAVEGFNLMPSAYMTINPDYDNNKLISFTFMGGGYGHGIGMSQNGSKILASKGMTYSDIIKYFYDETDIINIYESR